MDDFVRQVRRAAEAGDQDAWLRIENALRRQYDHLVGYPVWIVRYSHGHGTDINVFLTADEAYQGIEAIFDEYWEEEMGEIPRPDNVVEALELFNDQPHGEYIDIEESRIRGIREQRQ